MWEILKFTSLIFIILLTSSCKKLLNDDILIDDSTENIKNNFNFKKEQIEIRYSCGEDGITKYTDDGWILVEQFSQEIDLYMEVISSVKEL